MDTFDMRKETKRESAGGVTALRDRLREAIAAGEIPTDQSRTQTDLAELFAVSRTPLREALRMLELEQLIVREPNGRFRATDLSAAEVEELAVTTMILEAAAARHTVDGLLVADHAALEGLYAESQRLAEVGEWDAYEVVHRAFHATLTRDVGPMHIEQLNRLWDQASRYRQAFARSPQAEHREAISQREHRLILDTALDGDAEGTARRIARHHARCTEEIVALLEPGYATGRLDLTLAMVTDFSAPRLV
ncbi:MAG: GntR family transcriptional regulator [Actinobacteria bacterium]|nr:GntR family transcriptional regulator [Actinomycetota bacterium]